jgi:hypothetical protein
MILYIESTQTNAMEQCPWETNSHSASQEIPRSLWTPKVHCCRVSHWYLSWARWIQCTPSHPVSLRFILMISSHLCLDFLHGLFHCGFLTIILYAFLTSSVCYMPCPFHHLWLDHPNNTWWGIQVNEASHYAAFSSLLPLPPS